MTQNNLSLEQAVDSWEQQQQKMAAPASYDSVSQWLDNIRSRPCWIPMPDLAAVVVTGDDADKFLQGQLTCDMRQMTGTRWQPGAACTPKGRMVATFRMLKHDRGFVMVSTREGADALIKHLAKYIPFFKATMSLQEDWLPCYRVLATSMAQAPSDMPDHVVTGLVQENLAMVLLQRSMLQEEPIASMPARSPIDGFALDVQSGFPHLFAATSECFLPHEAGLTRIGGVSFRKGCYTGQEIVARMEYRGKLKQHVHLVSVHPPLAGPMAGQAIQARGETGDDVRKVGQWIYAVHDGGQLTFGLASLRDEILQAMPMTLENGSILHLEDGIGDATQQGENTHES